MSVKDHITHVEGEKKADIMLYALSTCGWCKRTKGLLSDTNVAYDYVDVDTLYGADREEALGEMRQFNPKATFPTMVINQEKCIVGFKEDEIREALGG